MHRVALAALLATTALISPVWADTAPVNPPMTAAPRAILPDFSDLAARVKPAVVSITTSTAGVRGIRQARGSGFIIDAGGTVVTNNHVVRDSQTVMVTLDDGTELKARVIGTDPRTDIAVLKVEAGKSLPYIQLGNSRQVRPGEWVIAMGNPFGLGGTVTAGIVSAVGRDIGSGPYDQFIQVDAPINQGNSGGPLFSQDGKVIGMNTAIFSPTGGSVGIGFAIPSDLIRSVTGELATSGFVTRGYVGVATQEVTPSVARALHMAAAKGALLAGVEPGSPAARSGLEPGDVIKTVNGQPVSSPRDLALIVSAVAPGQDARFGIIREGQERDIAVRVGKQRAAPIPAVDQDG